MRDFPAEMELASLFRDGAAPSKAALRDVLDRYRSFRIHPAATGAAERSLRDKLGDQVHALDFDAAGNAKDDDTASLQAAIDHVAKSGGGAVELGGGAHRYRVRKPLTLRSGVTLRGTGAQIIGRAADDLFTLVDIKGTGITISGVTLVNGRNSATGHVVHLAAGSSDIRIAGCTLTGDPEDNNALPGDYHLRGIGADQPDVRRVSITDCRFAFLKYGVLTTTGADDIEDVTIALCQFDAIAVDGIELNHPGAAYASGNRFLIIGNQIRVPPGMAADRDLLAAGGFGIGVAGATRVAIMGNTITGRLQGVHIEDEAKHITVVGNLIHGPERPEPGQGFLSNAVHCLDGDHVTIADNQIQAFAHDGIHLAFRKGEGLRNAVVSGNTVTGCGRNGIFLGDGVSRRVVCTGNVVDRCGAAIHVAGSGKDLSISGNMLSDNAAALRCTADASAFLWRDNQLSNNEIDIDRDKLTRPLTLAGFHRSFTEKAAGERINLMEVGGYASGRLTLSTQAADRPAAYRVEILEFLWNDGKLDVHARNTLAEDGLGSLEYEVEKGRLLARFKPPSGKRPKLEVTVQFDGVILVMPAESWLPEL